MSTENAPTDPIPAADPTAPAPKAPGTVEPDNWHTEGAAEAPAKGLLTDKPASTPGTVKPDNWHTESEPAN